MSLHVSVLPFYGQIIFRSMDIPHFVYHLSVDGHLGVSTFGLLWYIIFMINKLVQTKLLKWWGWTR